MPILNNAIPNTTTKIINPVSEQVTRSILKSLGLSELFGNNIYVNDQTSSGSNYKIDGKNKVLSNRCDVEIVPDHNPANNIFDTQSSKDDETKFVSRRRIIDTNYVFLDPLSMIYLHESSVPCSVELNFTFKVRSVSDMDTIAAKLNSMFMSSVESYQNHTIQTSYTIPDQVLILLHKLYKLKTHSNDVGATFPEYLSTLSNGMITHEVNRDNPNDIAIVIQNKGIRIVGRTNNTLGQYQTETENDVVTRYVHTFTYQFVFKKPSVINLEFPIVVDGQYVPQEYISKGELHELESLENRRASISFDNAKIDQRTVSLALSYPWIRFPNTDDWGGVNVHFPKFKDKFLVRFSGVCGLESDNSIRISISNEIFPILGQLDEVIQDAMSVTELEAHQSLKALYQVMLFSNDHMVSPADIILDADLDLVYFNADPKRIYRVVLAQMKDINLVRPEYFDHIFRYNEFYNDFIYANLRWLVERGYLQLITFVGTDALNLASLGSGGVGGYNGRGGIGSKISNDGTVSGSVGNKSNQTPTSSNPTKTLGEIPNSSIAPGYIPSTPKYEAVENDRTGPGQKITVHNYTLLVKRIR